MPSSQPDPYPISQYPIYRAWCLLCLSTLTFQEKDLPYKQGRIHIELSSEKSLLLKIPNFQNFLVYNYIENYFEHIYPSLLPSYDDLLSKLLDENTDLPAKVWPIHNYTKCIEFNNSKPVIRQGEFDYEDDKTNTFIKYFSIEKCPFSKNEHIIYLTYSDQYRYCDKCSFSITNDLLRQTIKVRELVDNFIYSK